MKYSYSPIALLTFCLCVLSNAYKHNDFKAIFLHQDIFGNYFIPVNFGNEDMDMTQFNSLAPHSDFNSISNKNVGKIMLNLYSNETVVGASGGYHAYPCQNLDCDYKSQDPRKVGLLYQGTTLNGRQMNINIQTSAFSALNIPVLHATDSKFNFIHDVHGSLGLGSGDNALFDTFTNFSIFLSNGKDGFNPALYIGQQDRLSHIYGNNEFAFTATTKKNWAMTMTDLEVTIPSEKYSTTLNLNKQYDIIFDLNTNVTGLPVNLYRIVTKVLEGYNVFCGEDTHKTNCRCEVNAQTNDLPTFGLIIDGNTSTTNTIPLIPELYFNKNTCEILVKPVSADKYGALKVNPSYDGSLILGQIFMKHYFVHFEHGQDNQTYVSLELEKQKAGMDSKDILISFGIIIVSFIIVIVAVLCYIYCTKEEKPENEEASFRESEKNVPLLRKKEDKVNSNEGEDEMTVSVLTVGKEKNHTERITAAHSLI